MALLSAVVARSKFRKLRRLPDIGKGVAYAIATLRFLTTLLLLVLLLQPALSLVRRIKVKPILVIAQDNSASLLNGGDSLFYRNGYGETLRSKLALLEKDFNVEWLTFDKQVKKGAIPDFKGHYTDVSAVFDYVRDNYVVDKPKAMLLLSDGIYNTGVNPRYKTGDYPIYTVTLGDTVQVPDVYIKDIDCDKFNFIHTIFPLKAEIAAVGQKGKTIRCLLRENGNLIGEEILSVDSDHYLKEVTFSVEAKRKGLVKYVLSVETAFEERSRENNTATIYVHVIDNSGEVLVLYRTPHPDVAAVTEALAGSGVYRCTARKLGERLPEDYRPALVVFHNPPFNSPDYMAAAKWADRQRTARWFILTSREEITDYVRYGNNGYTANFKTALDEYANPSYNRDFPYFEFSENEARAIADFPPLVVPFGELKGSGGKPLFFQRIKNTTVANEIMSFCDRPDYRVGLFFGEGLWRWRLFSYKENGSHDLFNTLVYKTVNYLSGRRGNDRFITDIEALYEETDEIVVQAELYNESYEMVNSPDVNVVLKHDGKEYDYSMNRYGDKYRIDFGNLQEGEYDYLFATDLKGERFEKRGTFYVRTRNSEANDVVADRGLMNEIARLTGGLSSEWNGLDTLLQGIRQRTDAKAEYKQEVSYVEWGELWWLGSILMFLLCVEWFLLKVYAG